MTHFLIALACLFFALWLMVTAPSQSDPIYGGRTTPAIRFEGKVHARP